MARTSHQPGRVCQLRVGDKYAYGRLFRDASIGIYRTLSSEPRQPPTGERDFLFIVGIYSDLPGSADCPFVGEDPFAPDEEAWPPPYKIVDPITGSVSIYHQGEIRPAEPGEQTDHLEKAAVWDLRHIVDRVANETGAGWANRQSADACFQTEPAPSTKSRPLMSRRIERKRG